MQAGAKVNFTAGGVTPLHIAADNGNPEIINCLLKAGADPNAIDEVCWIQKISRNKKINNKLSLWFILCQ